MDETWTPADDFMAYAYMDGAAGWYLPDDEWRDLDESYAWWWDKGSAERMFAGEMPYRDMP